VQEADSQQIIIFLGILAAFIAFLIIGGKSNTGSSSRKKSTTRKGGSYNKGSFRKAALSLGLSKHQVKVMEAMVKRLSIQNPFKLLNSNSYFDSILRKAIHTIDESTATTGEKEAQKAIIYSIRQTIEANTQRRQAAVKDSKVLRYGMDISLSDRPGYAIPTHVTGNVDTYFTAQTPLNPRGQKIRWHRGTKVKVSFWRNETEGYHFFTRVKGYKNIGGVSSVLLEHSKKIIPTQQRRYRRKQISRPAYVYPIMIMHFGRGKKQQKKAIVQENLGVMGTMLDISAGGCAIRSTHPKKEGTLVRVNFETERGNPLVIYGKVVRTRSAQLRGTVMHIKMTRISQKNLNKIRAFVYEID